MKTWHGYIEDDGGRRPGHLVLYPIEVDGLVHDNNKFKNISRCLLMEKWSQCKTSSRTHLLSLKEPRALTCLGNWPHSLWKQCIPPMEDKSDCCKLQAQFISLFRSCSHSFFLNTLLFIYCEFAFFCVQFTKFGMKLSPYGLSAKSLLILLRTFVLVRRR